MTVESAIDFTDSRIMVEDITDRVEELRDNIECYENEGGDLEKHDEHLDEKAELVMLEGILDELRGNGGDHQWEGNWYPQELIAGSAFVDYITDLIDECYEMPKEINSGDWPYRHMSIDYESAAKEAEQDYTTIEIDGNDFFYR